MEEQVFGILRHVTILLKVTIPLEAFIDFISLCLQGFSRSLAGPTMLELEKQVHGNANTFQIVFLLGAITFPLGNILGESIQMV